jgi:excisionase family DNA binding protein
VSEDELAPRAVMSVNDVCAFVGVTRRTVYNWVAADKVEYVRTPGGRLRIFADTLYRQEHDFSPPPEPTL